MEIRTPGKSTVLPTLREMLAARNAVAVCDPWNMQRELMRISAQEVPAIPMLTKDSLMYMALILEETAETILEGIDPAMRRAALKGFPDHEVKDAIRTNLLATATEMWNASNLIRNLLKTVASFAIPLNMEEAIGLFDGTTDVAVVNCGFALACGVPAQEGYNEVGGSNLSKVNPDTGMIDKTPDGKWIKGRDFKMPDLRMVLMKHVARAISKMDE